MNVRFFFCLICYCLTSYQFLHADEIKSPRINGTNAAVCVSCLQEDITLVADCVCNELTVTGNARIQDNVLIQGKVTTKESLVVAEDARIGGTVNADKVIVEHSVVAEAFQADCGSSLDCDLFVQDNATIANDLSVEGTLTVDTISVASSVVASTFETDCGSSLDCDLFVQDNATIANDLSVGGTLVVDAINVASSIIAPTIVASLFETDCGSSLDCDLFVQDSATITNDLSVGGTLVVDTISVASSVVASTFETDCGSSLDCDLFVQDNATIANDLSVGGTLTVDAISVTSSIVAPTIVASLFETDCGSSLDCDLFVQDSATITNDLSVGGTLTVDAITATSSIVAPTIVASLFETDCGSSLDCDLFVQDSATITNDLSVGGTLTVDAISVTSSIVAPTIVASLFETDCGSSLDCDLFVQDSATITNDLSVGGTLTVDAITATSSVIASLFETDCGSSLDCDLFVNNDATVSDSLSVGCDVTVGCNNEQYDRCRSWQYYKKW